MKLYDKPAGMAALSLGFTWLFFFEYLPPFRWVHIPYDLEAFHYALVDYAFQALRSGRFPEWDATLYCGASYVANPQSALFYPPTWLLFADQCPRASGPRVSVSGRAGAGGAGCFDRAAKVARPESRTGGCSCWR